MSELVYLNCDSLRANLRKAFNYLNEHSDISEVSIECDSKYSLAKTKYRFEIRTSESTTWITYVMHHDIPIEDCFERLARKYIDLVEFSNDEHFNGQIKFNK